MSSDMWSIIRFIGIIAVSSLAAVIGIYGVRRRYSSSDLRSHNPVTAPIHSAISVIYAVLLGFAVIVVWQQYYETQDSLAIEASQIISVNRTIDDFPQKYRDSMHRTLLAYTRSVIDVEWSQMEAGNVDWLHNPAYKDIWREVRSIQPENDAQRAAQSFMFDRLAMMQEMRTKRLLFAERDIPFPLWITLGIGGLICILITCFLEGEQKRLHPILSSLYAFIIGLMLALIAEFQTPYDGLMSVKPEPYRHTLARLETGDLK